MDQHPNIVQRLQSRLADARKLGLAVRLEVLENEQPSWCEIGGVPTLFIDLTQTAAEQLRQVDEILDCYQRQRGATPVASAGQQAA